jgi:aryl-alcohol dehydrogenase-like predicted oxidoreductase
VLRRREVTSVITGATRVEQLEENVTASGATIPPDLWARIDRLSRPAPAATDGATGGGR